MSEKFHPDECELLKKFVKDNDFLTRQVRGPVISAEECLEDGKVGEALDYIGDALKALDDPVTDNSAAIESLTAIQSKIKNLA